MMTIRVRVRKVDPYGYNGREHHPAATDEGVEGLVTNIEAVPDDEDEPDAETKQPYGFYQVFFVKLDNGREVELMGHEIDLVSCVHDGDL